MSRQAKKQPRVGIYSGSFDPVHTGHVTFALQAMHSARLDQVVFLPERTPRHKHTVEHFAHRVAMLNRATKPYTNMSVLELADKNFSIPRTWPQLQAIFTQAQLVVLVGSDVLAHMPDWPYIAALLSDSELVIGARVEDKPETIRAAVKAWPQKPQKIHVVQSYAPGVSSTKVRMALSKQRKTKGLLSSVHSYARANWLYISIEQATKKKLDKQ